MFESLSKRLGDAFDKMRRRGALSEADVDAALREVRVAFLEADVALPVVKDFIAQVKEKAVGEDVLKSVTPAQMVIKIVNDHLIEMLGKEPEALNLSGVPPVVVLMAGLQGSGKTTTTAKLAKFLTEKSRKKVLMASLDVYRPAAQEQLAILGRQIDVETVPIVEGEDPVTITKRAQKIARQEGYDVLLLDTAGRLHIDDKLMDEVKAVKDQSQALETLLVADAMTGQDAANVAKVFNERVGVTGIILTRVDGDARGGAALSMRSVSGAPIKFMGLGEKIHQMETFHPDRIAQRILGMGDVVSLVEKAAETIDQEEADKLSAKMQKGQFDLGDMATQLKQVSKMGGLSSLMGFLPGVDKFKDKIAKAGVDDSLVKRQIAIIQSMTRREKKYPKILNASRKKRVASGAGVTVQEINKLLKQFKDMSMMMKKMNKLGKKGMLRQGLKGLMPINV
ncbi:MAG: signal recognition particle protein [Alphaproteobacteria bacterium]|nr:signal recognition particle protein [Alphaproteobacteria bacterium]